MDALKNHITHFTHEFRTSLSLIFGATEQLLKQTEFQESYTRQQAILIKRSSQNFLALINQLLELAAVEFEPMTQNRHRGDLTDFMVLIADRFRKFTRHQRIRINLDSQLPVADYFFDRDKLDSLVTHLIGYALKRTPKSGRIQLSMAPHESPEGVSGTCITVQHSAPEMTQGPSSFPEGAHWLPSFPFLNEGDGVELTIARKIAASMEGTLEVTREGASGTQITLCLPLQPVDSSTPEKDLLPQLLSGKPEMNPDRCETGASECPVIQVISAHEDLSSFLRRELSPNYRVWTARDGEEGIAQVLEHGPDLIICEVKLPEKDGLEVCEALKTHSRTRHLPVMLLADQTSLKSRLEGLRKGADAYLTKPFSMEELTLKVRQLIAYRQLWEEKVQKKPANDKADASVSPDQALIDQLHVFVEKELDNEQLEVEDLVRETGMSRSQLYRKVKAATNLSLGAFIRDQRLRRAMELLRTGEYNVTEVTYLTGFSNRHHFYRSFVAKYKQAPNEVRKK